MKFNKKIIILAIILAAVSTYGVYYYIGLLESKTAAVETKVKEIKVWVAKEDIPARTKIKDNMVELKTFEETYVLNKSMKAGEVVAGKYTLDRIIKGEQILSDRVESIDNTYLSYQIPKGKRGITISVDDLEGLNHMISLGDRVDVMVYYSETLIEESSSRGILPDISKLVIQDALVVAIEKNFGQKQEIVDETVDKAKQAADKAQETEVDKREEKKITLAVTPLEAERLLLVNKTGQVQLTLRNPDDKETFETPGTIRKDIVPEKGKRVIPK